MDVSVTGHMPLTNTPHFEGFLFKELSKNVYIFTGVQTVHFFKPPPFKVYRPTFLGSKMKVPPRTFIIQQQNITIFQRCLIYVTNDTGL